MKYKISVIVPIYNAEKTLERCICSLLHQSYDNVEIILVNDGSKDCSLSICQNFAEKDDRIIVIDKKNGGVSSARNAGIDKASGDFLMFCDSDDWVKTDYCCEMLRYYSEGQLLMCEIAEIAKNEECKEILDEKKNIYIEEIDKAQFLQYKDKGLGSPTNKIFEKSIIEKAKIRFPESLFLGEDFAFVIFYLKCIPGNIQYLHEKLYVYQVDSKNSLSKKVPSCQQNELYYEILTDAMISFNGQNIETYQLRNRIIMYDFEKIFRGLMLKESISFVKLHKEIKKIISTKAYRACCKEGVGSSNLIYDWLYKLRNAVLLSIYFYFIVRKRN